MGKIRFDKNLLEIITERKMKQKELAKKTKLTEATISRYINGSRRPSTTNLIKIAKELGVSTDRLLKSEKELFEA